MVEKFINIIKDGNLSLPKLLLNNYIKLKITDRELIILIYLINDNDSVYNPSKISNFLNINITEVLTTISSLQEKGFLQIEIRKIDKLREEHILLDNLYSKLAFLVVKEEDKESDIYSMFEKEFGRTLSPMEYEIISSWLEKNYDETLVLKALKEAVFNHVSSLSYVDRILQEWKKKGIKTLEDVEKDKQKFVSKKQSTKQVFEYDWLNETKNS